MSYDDGDAWLDARREGDFEPSGWIRPTLLVRAHRELIVLGREVELTELAERLGAPKARVSVALNTLKESGLAKNVRRGVWKVGS